MLSSFKQFLTSIKLTVQSIEARYTSTISSIAEALSQSCYLQKLTKPGTAELGKLDQEWTNCSKVFIAIQHY